MLRPFGVYLFWNAKFKKLMGVDSLQKVGLCPRSVALIFDEEDEANDENDDPDGLESDVPMGKESTIFPSKGNEDEEMGDDHDSLPQQRTFSRGGGSHPPVFQTNDEVEGRRSGSV